MLKIIYEYLELGIEINVKFYISNYNYYKNKNYEAKAEDILKKIKFKASIIFKKKRKQIQ